MSTVTDHLVTVAYKGPTACTGSRFIVTAEEGRAVIPYDHSSCSPATDAARAALGRLGAYAPGLALQGKIGRVYVYTR